MPDAAPEALSALLQTTTPVSLRASLCRTSFRFFVREFWTAVPEAGVLRWNWHMDVICRELQEIAERICKGQARLHHLINNQPPATSKSMLHLVMFPAWFWTFYPQARCLTATHAERLGVDLARKCRDIIGSVQYQSWFPHVVIRGDKAGLDAYGNTLGGERMVFTVGGKSPVGFHAHALLCFPYNTPIIAEGGDIPIGKIVEEGLPVRVLGFNHTTGEREWQHIEARHSFPGKKLCRVHFDDNWWGIDATPDHPVFAHGRGYVPAAQLRTGDQLFPALGNRKVVGVGDTYEPVPERVYNLRVAGTRNYFAGGSHYGVLVHNCDDPIDPQGAISEAELRNARYFMTSVLPTRMVDKDVSVIILDMQRLSGTENGTGEMREDPTGVMLEQAAKGAYTVRHIRLPADLPAKALPPELGASYVDGLMDPVRLSRATLRGYEIGLQAHGYAAQFRQIPQALEGGMFKDYYFSKRVRASPYEAQRVVYVDRAATEGGGCATAMTVMSYYDGNWYVGPVYHGHWEPEERDRHIVAAAHDCRNRFGPKHEPPFVIEHEPGSSGVDAYRYTARKLAGFVVHPDRPTGKKEVRAEPWASQCAAGNVYIVDDGSWDVRAWIAEHCAFPQGALLDRVDSASGGFNWLVRKVLRPGAGRALRILSLGKSKVGLRLVVCSRAELEELHILEHVTLLIVFQDPGGGKLEVVLEPDMAVLPPPQVNGARVVQPVQTNPGLPGAVNGEEAVRCMKPEMSLPPPHALLKLAGWHAVCCLDLNPAEMQDTWDLPLAPHGKLPEELILGREGAKQLWRFILQKRDPIPTVWVVVDDGDPDRRALSAALALADCLRLPRESTLYRPGDEEWKAGARDLPPNPHLHDMIKTGRGLVL